MTAFLLFAVVSLASAAELAKRSTSASQPAGGGAWQGWTHGADGSIKVDVSKYEQKSEATGTTVQKWERTVNEKEAKSWANANINGHPALVFAQEEHQGSEAPHGNFAVFALASDAKTSSLERSDPEVITLVPVKPGSVKTAKTGSPMKMSKPAKRLNMRAADLEELEAGDEADNEADDADEEPALLQLGEGMYPFHPAYFYWSPWATYAAAGFTLNMMAASALAAPEKETKKDLERALNFPSLEIQLPSRAAPIKFRNAADLEMFFPAVASTLLFYPWGLAWGSAYYVAAVHTGLYMAGSLATMGTDYIDKSTAAFKKVWDTTAEWYKLPFNAATQLANEYKAKDWSAVASTWENWYWNMLWCMHIMSFWYLHWQMKGYFYMYWINMQYQPLAKWSEWWQKTAAAYQEYWKKAYKSYADAYASWYKSIGIAKAKKTEQAMMAYAQKANVTRA